RPDSRYAFLSQDSTRAAGGGSVGLAGTRMEVLWQSGHSIEFFTRPPLASRNPFSANTFGRETSCPTTLPSTEGPNLSRDDTQVVNSYRSGGWAVFRSLSAAAPLKLDVGHRDPHLHLVSSAASVLRPH